MILTGSGIERAVACGEIVLDPFDRARLNPNSYNYRLGPSIKVLERPILDGFQADHDARDVELPADGMILAPRRLYLGSTVETIGSNHYVASLIGRSSLGRLGVFLQVSANLGNIGAIHKWTLEIVVAQPIRIYPGMCIGQVSFWCPFGQRQPYDGYFGNFSEPVGSNPEVVAP